MKNILIPTDFSDNAKSALKYALKLYKNELCTFYFLHSTYLLNPVSRTYITPHYVNKLHKEGVKTLEEFETQTKNTNSNSKHHFQSIISQKKLSIAIDNAIKQREIELIIMSTKGTTDAIEYFAGSNTVEIVKKIKNCPILVIPDKYNFVEPKQIAFPTEFSHVYHYNELEPLKNIVKLYNSEIRVVHINPETKLSDVQANNKDILKVYFSEYKLNFNNLIDFEKKSKSINSFINKFKIDLLVMVNYKHSFIENIIKEPVIKSLVFHPKIPMMIIPE